MKNLFSFATKELSQDAFLRWFFENYKDLGEIVADFIRTFTKGFIDVELKDIDNIVTKAQLNDIDVVVDIFSDTFPFGHKTIVIEDKTTSEEHNQLGKYNKKIECWENETKQKGEEFVYKLYYKTYKVYDDEKIRVEKAKWNLFSIEEIYIFFEKYKDKVKSEILSDYINHIIKIHNDYQNESNDLPKNWNYTNFDIFMNNFIKKNFDNRAYFFSYSFRNMYQSLCVYVELGNRLSLLRYTVLEIQVRGTYLIPRFHPGFRIPDKNEKKGYKEEWRLDNYPNFKEIGLKELNELRNYVEESKSDIIKKSNHKISFAKVKNSIEFQTLTKEELEKQLKLLINEYITIAEGFSNNNKSK